MGQCSGQGAKGWVHQQHRASGSHLPPAIWARSGHLPLAGEERGWILTQGHAEPNFWSLRLSFLVSFLFVVFFFSFNNNSSSEINLAF